MLDSDPGSSSDHSTIVCDLIAVAAVDSDGAGLDDDDELAFEANTVGDGLTDSLVVPAGTTNPLAADSNGDGCPYAAQKKRRAEPPVSVFSESKFDCAFSAFDQR